MLLHAAVFFGVLAAATTLAGFMPGAISARIWFGLPLGGVVIVAIAGIGALVSGERDAVAVEVAVALVVTIAIRSFAPQWSWFGAQVFATATLASLAYLLYAASVSYNFQNGLAFIALSSLLLLLEVAALALSLSYLFEIVDTLSRSSEPRHKPDSNYLPKVAVQVPAYNEPLEVVGETLNALARLDFPDLIVQVVDNNTPDRANWMALKAYCEKLGPRFQFMHLENWPGFKAGALNEATRRLPKDVEIIGVVDADYVVDPDWLRSVVGYFADPNVAFVQTPQNYRDWADDQYLRGLFYSYQYFFDITMPARAHRNAIIFAGTMGLIRRRALEEIGGWNPEVVTEDAEASLRMLALGHRAIYVPHAFGHGLMPLTFDGLKKQRFRWALGGVQILRLHWRRLLLGTDAGRLTISQRIHYLLGNVQWFGDVLMFLFTLILMSTAISAAMHQSLPIRQMTGLAIGLPIAFLASGLTRAVWAMKIKTGCAWRDAIAGLRVWFALSWVVTLACIRGLITFQAAFLRTPKQKEGDRSLVRAIRSSQVESMLAGAGLVAAVLMVAKAPSIATGAVAVLLLFQASIYANAPWAGASAEGINLTPLRRAYRYAEQFDDRRGLSFALPVAAAVTGLALVVLISLSAPQLPKLQLPTLPQPQPASPARVTSPTPPTQTSSPARTSSASR
ncbi:MAG TPA: glycosyltransferase [Candidatus Dormibacteraeota bacterium]|nr:glycosyltransferase [Candidatus Dormibacteraeota bacterium]